MHIRANWIDGEQACRLNLQYDSVSTNFNQAYGIHPTTI